jgi:hypothetical protein
MSSREQFESRFPVPEGVAWNPETSRYVLFHLKRATVAIYEAHVERWVVWQAAREALLTQQAKEQEEFLAHLADFEHEDTFHD